jgi:RNA polymerase sigma factor (sigma-70 family)
MPQGPINEVVRRLRHSLEDRDAARLSDGQLLEAYRGRGEAAAFGELLRRHGPMVFGVCHRMLRSADDAEDAFQATFLILIRKAASVRPAERVGNWLYGVAWHTARKARAMNERRRAREKPLAAAVEPAAPGQEREELHEWLDTAVRGLPDAYRTVVVLCELEGRTLQDAAQQLGWPVGTVAGRLSRARQLLARRLRARPAVLAAGIPLVAAELASAQVPPALAARVLLTNELLATGLPLPGSVPARVAALAEQVMKSLWLSGLRRLVAVVVVLGLLGLGVAAWCQSPAPRPEEAGEPRALADQPVPKADPKPGEAAMAIAWGRTVDGVQIGLALRGGTTVRVGETATFVLLARNTTDKEVSLTYADTSFLALMTVPAFSNDKGENLEIRPTPIPDILILTRRVTITLKPGATVELGESAWPLVDLQASPPTNYVRAQPGTWSVRFEDVRCDHLDLPKRGTGKLVVRILPARK